MATPWPDKPCPHCGKTIMDLISEMVPDAQQQDPELVAVAMRRPGGAITCPFCQGAVEYHPNGQDLVASTRPPLRYSRQKIEDRAKGFGVVFLAKQETSPEEWMEIDKGMPGALSGYRYAEDSP